MIQKKIAGLIIGMVHTVFPYFIYMPKVKEEENGDQIKTAPNLKKN